MTARTQASVTAPVPNTVAKLGDKGVGPSISGIVFSGYDSPVDIEYVSLK